VNADSSGQNTVREPEHANTEELTDEYNGSHFSPAKPQLAPFTQPLRKSRRVKLRITKNSQNQYEPVQMMQATSEGRHHSDMQG
jgi:hypothetical protein